MLLLTLLHLIEVLNRRLDQGMIVHGELADVFACLPLSADGNVLHWRLHYHLVRHNFTTAICHRQEIVRIYVGRVDVDDELLISIGDQNTIHLHFVDLSVAACLKFLLSRLVIQAVHVDTVDASATKQ